MRGKPKSQWEAVSLIDRILTIRDLNQGWVSVTNDVENVVWELMQSGILKVGMRLMYYDSNNDLDEIKFDENGFVGFGYERTRTPVE